MKLLKRGWFVLSVVLVVFVLCNAQIPNELPCASGSSDMESPTFNGSTQKVRSWLCVDATGHVSSPVFVSSVSGVTSVFGNTGPTITALNISTGSSLTFSGTGTNNANLINGAVVPLSAVALTSNGSGQLVAGTVGGDLTGGLTLGAGFSVTDANANNILGGVSQFTLTAGVGGLLQLANSSLLQTPGTWTIKANGNSAVFTGGGNNITLAPDGVLTTTLTLGTGVIVPFSLLSSSTNTTAAMIVGTGASLTTSGTGSINASLLNGTSATNQPVTSGQILDSTAANVSAWNNQPTLGSVGFGTGRISFAGNTSGTVSLTCLAAVCTTLNSTAPLTVTGTVAAPTYATTTKCAAVGSGANPSVAACVAAPAGVFSCATASAGNCQVTTTAMISANSTVIVTQDTSTTTGTLLGVTCNTTPSVVNPSTTTAKVAATSFSFSITTPVTNPDCFQYWIVN